MLKNILLVVLIIFIVSRVRKMMNAHKDEDAAPHARKNYSDRVIDLEQDPNTKIYQSKNKKH